MYYAPSTQGTLRLKAQVFAIGSSQLFKSTRGHVWILLADKPRKHPTLKSWEFNWNLFAICHFHSSFSFFFICLRVRRSIAHVGEQADIPGVVAKLVFKSSCLPQKIHVGPYPYSLAPGK